MASLRGESGAIHCLLRSNHQNAELGVDTTSDNIKTIRQSKTKLEYGYGRRSTKSKCKPGLRKGKWTPEEEAYTNMLVDLFKAGLLQIEEGKSLRSFLSEKLNCEPMRITKKFAGSMAIGKQVFVPRPAHAVAIPGLEKYEKKLLALRRKFLGRLEQLPKRIETVAFNSSSFAKGSENRMSDLLAATLPISKQIDSKSYTFCDTTDGRKDLTDVIESPRSIPTICSTDIHKSRDPLNELNTDYNLGTESDCTGASLLINFISSVHKNQLAIPETTNDDSEPTSKRSRVWHMPICA